jgi:hypothetical protein
VKGSSTKSESTKSEKFLDIGKKTSNLTTVPTTPRKDKTMQATLNVGLLNSKDGSTIPDQFALNEVKRFFAVLDHKFAQSETERTLVAKVQADEHLRVNTYNLALMLDQDCVAICFGKYGALIGPRAYAWGEFNPDYFINL